MPLKNKIMTKENKKTSNAKYYFAFAAAIILGILNGIYPTSFGIACAEFLSNVFVRLFKFVSVPVIGITICLTIATLGSGKTQKNLWKRTLAYTLSTTVLAAFVAATLYYIFTPENASSAALSATGLETSKSYLDYFITVIPDNPLAPFVQGNVLSVLLIAITTGIAVRYIGEEENKQVFIRFLGAVQSILFFIVKIIITLLPLGIFGFTSICAKDFSAGIALNGLGKYFTIIISSNLIQGFIILPLFLIVKKLNPLKTAKAMSKALTVAFFSKSSAGTLPITMACAEQENNIKPAVSRFVLPICTTINMNGCASFILITVVYLMQNNAMPITIPTLITWVFISTVAAIGNAGVPMGCYFLAASLLSSMNVPIQLLGIILPFYTVLDMVETSLNVWSDSCIATMVNKDIKDIPSLQETTQI